MAELPQDPAVDLAMVRAVLANDSVAIAALWTRLACVPRVLSGLNAKLGRALDRHDLEDVAQDVRRTLLNKLAEYSGGGVLEAWAFRICHFELLNAVRRKWRRQRYGDPLDESLCDEAAARVWRQMLARDAIDAAIDRIGGFEADTVRMKHFEGLSFEQIAARQAATTTAVKARYGRAMKRLEEVLGHHNERGADESI